MSEATIPVQAAAGPGLAEGVVAVGLISWLFFAGVKPHLAS